MVSPSRAAPRPTLDPALLDQIKPLTLSTERLLAVPESLQSLFAWGGIQRGWSIGVAGEGAWSLAMAIWAEALGSEGWAAIVGVPDLGLVAAAEQGVRLDRVIVIETPPAAQWASVVAALLEAFDIVAVAPDARVGQREARRLVARAKEQESVLFHLDGGLRWPMAVDMTLRGVGSDWDGIGWGHGHVRGRRLTVEAEGRRMGAVRTASVLL